MRFIVNILVVFLSITGFAQETTEPQDSLKEYEGNVVPVYTDDYLKKYNRLKRMVVKVYPYALHAADVIDQIDQDAESITKRRKKNKFYRHSYRELRDEFKYFILDLYTSEGQMLMKLIHRETGMTVYDISNKYRGKQKAEMFNLMAKIWEQDLHAEFKPTEGEDKITEQVIRDIQEGLIPFTDEIVTIDKLEWKEKERAERKQRRKNKKRNREYKRKRKERERAARKKKRKNRTKEG